MTRSASCCSSVRRVRSLAEKALDWAIRFVGAEAGFIADSDGSVLAAKGMDEAQAERLKAQLGAPEQEGMRAIPGTEPQTAVVVPLPLDSGTGVLAVVSGPFTPFFGTEEVGRLTGYATNVTAGLDRAILTERIAALERTKSEFLNLASHELRGPITVIRGYLSMLERGSLGEIPEGARKALPVLTAKADEMNALVEQMIEAARLEEGRLELSPAAPTCARSPARRSRWRSPSPTRPMPWSSRAPTSRSR